MNTNELEVIMNNRNLYYEKEFHISELNRRIDYYLPNYNLLIEFDGAQHHKPVDYFSGIEGYIKDNENDARKTLWCIDNGYHFVRLNHFMNERDIIRILSYFIDSYDENYNTDIMTVIDNEENNINSFPYIDEFLKLYCTKLIYLNQLYDQYMQFLKQLHIDENVTYKDFKQYSINFFNLEYKKIDIINDKASEVFYNHNYEDYKYENKEYLHLNENDIIYQFVKSLKENDLLHNNVLPTNILYQAYCKFSKEFNPSAAVKSKVTFTKSIKEYLLQEGFEYNKTQRSKSYISNNVSIKEFEDAYFIKINEIKKSICFEKINN